MFHWICPECGREIPPSVRECQVCDPSAAAASIVEPVESAPAAEALAVPPPLPETVAVAPVAAPIPQEPLLLEAAAQPVAAPIIETAPIAETAPVAEAAPAAESPAVEPITEVLPVPETIAVEEPAMELAAPAPAVEAAEPTVAESVPAEPVTGNLPEPAIELTAAAPTVEAVLPAEPIVAESVPAEPVTENLPVAETIAVEEPAVELAAAEPAPVAPVLETAPVAEAEPVAEKPVLESTPVAEPAIEVLPVAAPVMEVPAIALAEPKPAPPVDLKPAIAEAHEAPIKLHDVPDPLLALAEEIRAAQLARAAALATPPPSAGLLELAEAIGIQERAPEPSLPVEQPKPVEQAKEVEHAEPVFPSVAPAAPTWKIQVAEAVAVAEASTAVALLAPPELEQAPAIAPEPVGFHELRPAALAPEPQPTAEPEPVALAEPQAPPIALAPEPQPEAEGPTLPFAPMQDYTPATSRSIMPVPPPQQILSADSGPRITLPGPTLPPELTRLQDANVVTVIGEDTAQRTKEAIPPSKSAGTPGWVVSVLVMLLLLAAGLGVVFYLLPHTVADAKPTPTPAVAATTPAPTGGTSPLAKFVEVTGFRIVTSSADANKKSEVQYLVVNHSDADISDANVFVTLRSAKPGQAPVCRFSFKVPSLGPFESKEMSSPIGNPTRAVSLPDWQDMRAEVQISQ